MTIFYALLYNLDQLANFGLARNPYESSNQSHETRVLKTFEYLAPECGEIGIDLSKADVYSFGVVLLELVTGRKSIDETNGQSFLRWVTRHHTFIKMAQKICSDFEFSDSLCCTILENRSSCSTQWLH